MRISRQLTAALLGFSALGLSLSGCKTFMDPTFLPAGYTYHQNEAKSPTADEPWSIGYDYTHEKNAEVIAHWQQVAAELVTKLEPSGATSAGPIFLASPELDNAFTISLDNALRQELRSRGYILAAVPDVGTVNLKTSAYDPEFSDNFLSYEFNDTEEELPEPPKVMYKNIVIKIQGEVEGKPITLVESYHAQLPLYGYQYPQRYFPMAHDIAEVWR
jgi:hypothetical protein